MLSGIFEWDFEQENPALSILDAAKFDRLDVK
jgi:hypothetical protein